MRRDRRSSGAPPENELRAWLRDRDAGPAPERLRMRVGHVTEDAARRTTWALWRPISALAGAAAVAILVFFAATMRGPAGPRAGVPSQTAGPTPTASSDTLGLMPIGPWPRTGPVLALPIDGPLFALLVAIPLLAALLLIVYLTRRSFADASRSVDQAGSSAGLREIRPPRAWALRLAAVMLVAALIVVGCDLFQLGQSAPLTYGGFEGADPSLTIGYRNGTAAGNGETYLSFVPGGQLRIDLELSNEGQLPLTVTSFDTQLFGEQPAAPFISSVEFRLPPGATMGAGGPADDYYTQPFHPFEIPPRGSSTMLMVLHLKTCPSVAAGPTPGPNAFSNNGYLPTTGYVTIGMLPFRYSVMGIEQETYVLLNEALGLVFGSDVVTC